MVNYRFRHGPALGVKPRTDHRSRDRLFWNKFKNAGSLGWCQTCTHKDVPATTDAVWVNPITDERFDVVVCAACAKDCQDVRDVP